MLNKKYQIFVSSTYEDLKDERKAVIEQILNMGHLPVGMELFVASDDEQFEYIKRIIDNCDYYVLILGGRYGSISPNTGISYTEMEYNYAVEKNIPVLVFPFIDIDKLPVKKKDKDLTQITNFINKATGSRIRKAWENKAHLCINVMNSLYRNFEENPQSGWIRPEEYDNSKLLNEINELRKYNSELEKKIAEYKKQLTPNISDLANMNEEFELHFQYVENNSHHLWNSKINITWNQIFSYIAPKLISPKSAGLLKYEIDAPLINKLASKKYEKVYIEDDDFQTIKIQFMTQGLLNAYPANNTKGGVTEFIQITQKGKSYMQQIKTVKTTKSKELSTD